MFQEIFTFIYSATLPKLKKDEDGKTIVSPTLLETLTPTKTEQTATTDAPISNQFIDVDFNEHTALVSATLR